MPDGYILKKIVYLICHVCCFINCSFEQVLLVHFQILATPRSQLKHVLIDMVM